MSDTLKDGMDSGDVPEKVKLQVFVNGIGICAAPDCSDRLMRNRTKLGECAHIIPRRVGSHPREDYTTPLDDRKKEENLLFLCEKHHKLVDDKQHAEYYTAELLRGWKQHHEAWATGVTKNSPHLPQNLKDMFASFGTQIAEQINVSETIIGTLLDTCRELLERQLVNEARVFLSQIDLLLLGANNSSLNTRADLLNAILFIRNEQIPEAKGQLLQIIQSNPHDVEAMLEYVELCDSTPEPDDRAEGIEQIVRTLDTAHPKLLLLDLARKYKNQEIIETQDISNYLTDDVRLNARFYRQYALFFDRVQETAQRDDLINRWESELPNSPRPHLFRTLFREFDLLRTPGTTPVDMARLAQNALRFSQKEKSRIKDKDPLTVRDQISWLMQEIRLELVCSSGRDLGELRSALVSLIMQCYFDSFINGALQEFLTKIRIEPDQWRAITRKILASKMLPSKPVVELLFLQALRYDELYADLAGFINIQAHSDLPAILHAIQDGDVVTAAEKINTRNSEFTLYLLQSIAEHEIAALLTDMLEVDQDHQLDLFYTQLMVFDLNELDNEALDLIRSFPLNEAGQHVLHTIGRITYRNKQWHLFIPPALQLLEFDIPQSYKSQLHAELALAYFEQGDDSNAINHADQALSQSDELGEMNSQNLLYVLGQSLVMKGRSDEACKKYQQYEHIKRSFPLLLAEADSYLKSNFPDKHEKSLSLILQAFREADVYDDQIYVGSLMLLIELDNAGKISTEDESSVEDEFFVKLEGIADGWFYIGERDNSLGAECISPGTPNYAAVIHKSISDEIDWPADQFSGRDVKRKILHIAAAPAFLSHRAHEAMQRIATIGNAPIWSIQVVQEDGSLNIDNIKRFFDQFEHVNEFFERYISIPVPFSFLCTMMGSLAQALGKITSERKGFVRCNDGTQADMDAQKAAANEVLQGAICFMDGLSALMLTEAGLLQVVIKTLPNLGISTSVIRLLREIAGQFETSSSRGGWARFVDGSLRFNPSDKDKDASIRKHFLLSADLLDQLPNKVIARNYPQLEGARSQDHLIPDYFVDAFRYAQEKEAYILTDDALLVQSYRLIGESPIPRHFSSMSLIRLMADNGLITWDDYLKYFALLTFYRYHFLPITVDDLIQTVFPPAVRGLVTSSPQNISRLNLQLTLSPEYGVDDKTAVGVLASFFVRLIQDDTVPPEITDEVFALTIWQGLAQRDRRLTARTLVQICRQNILERDWVSPRSKAKLEILDKQLFGFAQGLNPIIIESPLALRITDATKDNRY